MRNDWAIQQAQDEGSAGQADCGGGGMPAPETEDSPRSWKVEVVMDDSGEWESDPLRFETRDEALAYARDLDLRWAAVRDRRVMKSADPVNRQWPRAREGREG
jgi:hypothetical protein